MVPIAIFEDLPEVSHRRRREVNCAGMHFSHVLTHKALDDKGRTSHAQSPAGWHN